MSVRGLLVVALVVMALVVAFLLGGGSSGGTAAQAADDDSSATSPTGHRLLTMTGVGEATAVPDQLSFALGVNVTRPDLDVALDAANRSMARVLAALQDHGVTKGDVQTTGLSMNPVYDYHQYSPPTISGYHVSERARVLVKELQEGGAAVTSAVAAGGNDVRVSDIRLLVGDTDAVMASARDAAVAEATAKAEQYAAASGQELGDVMALREVHVRPLPTAPAAYLGRSAGVAGSYDLAALPVRAGKDRTSVTVRIVWSLG